jgi:asparagine synthase (glutamine-hydrolysing)
MCGILGFQSKNKEISEEHLNKMHSVISHRGPDAAGIYIDKNKKTALAHRRLSIIDLSEHANQPFFSECGKFVMVFNGEIYNYKAIAKQLKDDGLVENFRTSSDTEIALYAMIHYGAKKAANLFNGMFAIALYDIEKEEIHLVRDRVGIKPIYYFDKEETVIFSSELKSIKQVQDITGKFTLDKEAVFAYLHTGFISEPLSIFEEVKKFPAGNFGLIKNGKISFEPFWSIDNCIKKEKNKSNSETELIKELEEIIMSSVSLRLVSDVPFGTFLSGGTDSGVVTAMAAKIYGKNLNTFSIGLKDAKLSEAQFSKEIAKYLGTNHHEYILTENDALEEVGKIVPFWDEPFADGSAIPTMLVSKMAAKEVKMVLSGDGGDELFLGYGAYTWANRLDTFGVNSSKKIIKKALELGGNRLKRGAQLFDYEDKKTLKSHILSQEQYFFKRNEIKECINPKFYKSFFWEEEVKNSPRKLDAKEQQAIFDLKYYLKDDLLVKVDRASMIHSIEARVPLLDYRLIEWALNLDVSFKIKENSAKYLLKKLLYQYVPETYYNRKKQGFSIPLVKWLKTELKYLVDENLSKKAIEEFGILNYEYVKILKENYYSGKSDYLYNRIWNLLILQIWLEENKNILNPLNER